MASYDELKLKEYKHWTLYLHGNQCYLGRAYAWLKRPGEMQKLSDITEEERDSLWYTTMRRYELAIARLWQPDHMNYSWLGNEFAAHQGHGHLHLIPRYQHEVHFAGEIFTDDRWGQNYAPYPKVEFADDKLFAIRDALRKELK